jgi:hypothetical protein
MDIQNPIQKRLVWGLALYEVFVISAVAYAGVVTATAGGGPILSAIPVLVVAASEALRVPLSAWATRLSLGNRLLALTVLGALAVVSAEGLALSFDNLIAARTKAVTDAQRVVDTASAAVAAIEDKRAGAKADLEVAEREAAAAGAKVSSMIAAPPQAPGFSGSTCRNSRGATYACPQDMAAQRTFAQARADYAHRLSDAEGAAKAARTAADARQGVLAGITAGAAADALAKARRGLADAAEASPMHRIAASWFGVRAGELTEAQFSAFRKYAVAGLSLSLATLSALTAWLAFQRPRDDRRSALSRSLRALIARHRKRIVVERVVEREVEKVVQIVKEVPIHVTTIRHVPVDYRNGRFVRAEEKEIVSGDANPVLRAIAGGR